MKTEKEIREKLEEIEKAILDRKAGYTLFKGNHRKDTIFLFPGEGWEDTLRLGRQILEWILESGNYDSSLKAEGKKGRMG